jgi:hypothetical protein
MALLFRWALRSLHTQRALISNCVPRPEAAAPIGFGRLNGRASQRRRSCSQKLLTTHGEAFTLLLSRLGPCCCGADKTPTPASYLSDELEAATVSGPAGAIMCTASSPIFAASKPASLLSAPAFGRRASGEPCTQNQRCPQIPAHLIIARPG